MPTWSTAIPDMTSLSTSGRKLYGKTVENTASEAFGWNFSRTVQARILKFYKFIEDNRSHKNLLEMTSPAASGRLQNVIKCCTKVPKTGPAGQESNNSATYCLITKPCRDIRPDIV